MRRRRLGPAQMKGNHARPRALSPDMESCMVEPVVERPIVETEVQAKQGRWGAPVFIVLVVGIALVVMAFALVALFRPS